MWSWSTPTWGAPTFTRVSASPARPGPWPTSSSGASTPLEEALTETGAPGLRLLSGAGDLLTAANIKHAQKIRILNKIRGLDVDVVLIDIGAGTSFNSLDFFLVSDLAVLAVVPEPSSI